jgi:hypothetical protein
MGNCGPWRNREGVDEFVLMTESEKGSGLRTFACKTCEFGIRYRSQNVSACSVIPSDDDIHDELEAHKTTNYEIISMMREGKLGPDNVPVSALVKRGQPLIAMLFHLSHCERGRRPELQKTIENGLLLWYSNLNEVTENSAGPSKVARLDPTILKYTANSSLGHILDESSSEEEEALTQLA